MLEKRLEDQRQGKCNRFERGSRGKCQKPTRKQGRLSFGVAIDVLVTIAFLSGGGALPHGRASDASFLERSKVKGLPR